MDTALGDQPVRLPGFAVVGEVRTDDPFQVHPEVAVVVLVHETRGGCAGHDGAAALGDVHAGAERLPAGVFEDDVRVVAAGELPDLRAEPLPLLRVLGVLVLPEPVVLGGAVDDQLRTHTAADVRLLGTGDHAHRDRAGVGISWFAFTRLSSASPPKLVSKPQIRCCGSIIVSSWPCGSSSSTDRQCATTSSPAFHLVTPGPTRSTTPARSDPTTW